MKGRKRGGNLVCGGRALPLAPIALACLAAALSLAPPASAQVLRGSFDTLPGQDDDFSPYALGSAPDTAFRDPDEPPMDRAEYGRRRSNTPTVQPAQAAAPITPEPRLRRRPPAEEDPFSQLGLRLGAFLIKPSVEAWGGYDTNPPTTDPPSGSLFGRTQSQLDVESDWIRHEFRGRLEHSYRAYEDFPERDAPEYAADAALRLDVRRDIRMDFSLRAAVENETRGDPELIDVPDLTENRRLSGLASLTYKPGNLSITPAYEADRRVFEGIEELNYLQQELRLRTGYELWHPGLEPFVEVSVNERTYDEEFNGLGLRHNSSGYRAYAGVRVEPDPIWAFEGKLGYGYQEIADDLVAPQEGLVAEGLLIWKPSVLTEVRLRGGRDLEPSTAECCGLSDTWNIGAGFEHEFRRWLILTGDVFYEELSYPTSDDLYRQLDASLELEYKFNRTLSAKGRVAYERLDGSDPGDDYEAAIFEVGMRVQR